MIGKIVKIVSRSLYYGIEGIVEKIEGDQAIVCALVDEPGTGMLVCSRKAPDRHPGQAA